MAVADEARRRCRGARERVDPAVVGDPHQWAAPHGFDDDHREECNESRRGPAVDDGGSDDEDRCERRAADRNLLEGNRDCLGEDRRGQKRPCARQSGQARRRGRDRKGRDDDHNGAENDDRENDREKPSGLAVQPAFRLPFRPPVARADELCSPPSHRAPFRPRGRNPDISPFRQALSVLHTRATLRHPPFGANLTFSLQKAHTACRSR